MLNELHPPARPKWGGGHLKNCLFICVSSLNADTNFLRYGEAKGGRGYLGIQAQAGHRRDAAIQRGNPPPKV